MENSLMKRIFVFFVLIAAMFFTACDSAPVLQYLFVNAVDQTYIELARPTLKAKVTPTPSVKAYIGLNGVISISGKTVTGFIKGPVDVSTSGYRFDNLQVGTVYRIIVIAQNSKGYSVKQITQATKGIVPILDELSISSFDTLSITLKKPTFSTAGTPLPTLNAYIGYAGTIAISGVNVTGYEQGPVDVSQGDYQFSGLNPYKLYTIIVVALNADGSSVVQIDQWTQVFHGELDPSFGSGGKILTSICPDEDFAESVAIQPDGKIVTAGYSFNGSNYDFALARHNIDGSLDNSFGGDGIVTTAIGSNNDWAFSVAIQPDAKIVAVGYSKNGSNTNFALARYNPDGSLDPSFGIGGRVTTAIGSGEDIAYSVAIQPDGKIVVAGASNNGSNYDFALARYNSNGSIDETFGALGKVTTAIGASSIEIIHSVVIQPDGKIVAVGYSSNGPNTSDFALARYNSDGSLDSSFDTDGIVTTAIGTGDDIANSILIQPDGKIVAAGYSKIGTTNDFALVRYNTDGSLDTSFGTSGKITTAIGSGGDIAKSITIQADGKIVAAGYSSLDFALARYNRDGSLDTSFGAAGKVTTAINPSSDAGACSVAIQPDGRIIAAGYSYNGVPTRYDFTLTRYLP